VPDVLCQTERAILTVVRAAEESSRDTDEATDGAGLSVLATRVLGQLSLSAWLPATFFTIMLGLVVQFRR
jgi:hypothetical protein